MSRLVRSLAVLAVLTSVLPAPARAQEATPLTFAPKGQTQNRFAAVT